MKQTYTKVKSSGRSFSRGQSTIRQSNKAQGSKHRAKRDGHNTLTLIHEKATLGGKEHFNIGGRGDDETQV